MMETNPKPIIDREIRKTQRVVESVDDLGTVDTVVGDLIRIRNRNADFKLERTDRGKYYRIQGHTTVPFTNRLKFHSNVLTGGAATFLTLPPGSTVRVLTRVPLNSVLPSANFNARVANKYFGFRTVSDAIQFAVQAGASGSDSLEIESVTDEFGNVYPLATAYTCNDLPRNKWLWVTVRVHTNTLTLSGDNAFVLSTYYNTSYSEFTDYRECVITRSTGQVLSWDFEDGLTSSGDYAVAMTAVGTTPLNDVEAQHNGYNIIEQTDPYKLYSVQPINGFVTPEMLGAAKQTNPNNTDDSIDATEAIQAGISSGIPIRVDGFYYVKGRDKLPDEPFRVGFDIINPTTIVMDGSSDGVGFALGNVLVNNYGVVDTSDPAPAVPNPELPSLGAWGSASPYAAWYADGQNWQLKWDGSAWTIEGDGAGPPIFRGRYSGDGLSPAASASTFRGVYTALSNATGSVTLYENYSELPQESEGLGCLYTGADPVDLFRIFTSNFYFHGGLIYFGNTRYTLADNPNLSDYHTLSPYYVQPKAFTYYWYYETIVASNIETQIYCAPTECAKYNGGHIGLFFDNSRTPAASPIRRPLGFGEMHKCDFTLRGRDLYALVYLTDREPYQDFGVLIKDLTVATAADYNTHGLKAFKSSSPVDQGGGVYTIDSPSNYTVDSGSYRKFSIRWGNSGIRCFNVDYSSSFNFWEQINNALIAADFPSGVEFVAKAHPTGTNQSFRIESNQENFELRVYKNSTAAWHRMDLFSWGCKTMKIGLVNTSEFKIHFQPATYLRTSGDPGATGLDENYSELDFPCVTAEVGSNTFDLTTVDIGLVNGNNRSLDNLGDDNVFIGGSRNAIDFGNANMLYAPRNSTGDFHNHENFHHVRVTGSDTDSFIGPVDNILYYADKRATVTVNCYENYEDSFNFDTPNSALLKADGTARSPVEAVLDNARANWGSLSTGTGNGVFQNLFNDQLLGVYFTYESGFDEDNDFIEIVIENFTISDGATIYRQYLEWDRHWAPKRMQIMQVAGANGANTGKVMYDTASMGRGWVMTDALTTYGNTKLILRLIGCKSKTRKFNLKTWQAKDRNFKNSQKPYLSIGGGTRIYNTTEFEGLKVMGEDGNYHQLVPQETGSIPDLATLISRLEAAKVLIAP